MKKQIILALSVVLVLGLVIAAYAFNKTNNGSDRAAHSCPMMTEKAHAADNHEKTPCCDKEDCCCKSGDSCPMKMHGENAAADSCPMKDKAAQATGAEMKNVTVAHGESCCKKGASCCSGGACCKNKHN